MSQALTSYQFTYESGDMVEKSMSWSAAMQLLDALDGIERQSRQHDDENACLARKNLSIHAKALRLALYGAIGD